MYRQQQTKAYSDFLDTLRKEERAGRLDDRSGRWVDGADDGNARVAR